jgi:hypothetical protein
MNEFPVSHSIPSNRLSKVKTFFIFLIEKDGTEHESSNNNNPQMSEIEVQQYEYEVVANHDRQPSIFMCNLMEIRVDS